MGAGEGSKCDAFKIFGKEDVMKKNKQKKQAEVKTCALCGREIFGDYEYVKTKRKTEMYFHKGMECQKGKKNGKCD